MPLSSRNQQLAFFIVLFIAFAFLPSSMAQPQKGKALVRLQVDSLEVSQYDPILSKVTLCNHGASDIILKRSFGGLFSTLSFNVKPESSTRIYAHRPLGYGDDCTIPIRSTSLIPNTCRISYEYLACSASQPISRTTGSIEIEVAVKIVDAGDVKSDFVYITVKSLPESELEWIRTRQHLIPMWLQLGSHVPEDGHDGLSKFLSRLSDTGLKKHCTAVLLLSQMRSAKNLDDEKLRENDWALFEKKLDATSRSRYTLTRAAVLADKGRIDAATALLANNPDAGYERDEILAVLKTKKEVRR